MSYQGPNASVRQEFVVSPGATAVENLPSVAVATAYDVFKTETIGSSFGIIDRTIPWGTDNQVVYKPSIAGDRAFEMYPPQAYANSAIGSINLGLSDSSYSNSGISVTRDEMFALPGVGATSGTSQAIIPFYSAVLSNTGDVQIFSSSLNIVVVKGGSVVTSQVKSGQQVFISSNSGSTWTLVGTVGSVGTDETTIFLSQAYPAAITNGNAILVGAAGAASPLNGNPENFFDPSADFIAAKVKVGDVIQFSSLSIPGSDTSPRMATVTAVMGKNMLRMNTVVLPQGSADSNFTQYFPQYGASQGPNQIGSTVSVDTYSINRLVGFSQNYELKALNAGAGIHISGVDGTYSTFTVPKTGTPSLSVGDVFIITSNNTNLTPPDSPFEDRDTLYAASNLYRIKSIAIVGSTYKIQTDQQMYVADLSTTHVANGDFLQAWHPIIETPIAADFRAIRSEDHNVVKRITGIQDIYTAWVRPEETSIDPRNELAFMMSIVFGLNGGKVCYGVNVDSSATNLSTEYEAAMEELKLVDVYSHCFGTTDSGVNGLVGPYCDDQASPYEAHERIGVIAYDLNDIYLMGSDSGSINAITGQVTITGAFNPVTAGVTVGDIVNIYDSTGAFVTSANVTVTPSTVDLLHVSTDYSGSSITTPTFKFESGRKNDQAIRGGDVQYGNRRVTMVWPGWFYADFSGSTLLLPPYFVSAAITGLDGGIKVSQSLTNMPYSIPGLSNIQLGTNTYFRKADLDQIGGGGVDIMIQDATVTQSIKSRHDLTTDMSSVQSRERSITKQADVCAKTIRSSVAPYVGRYNITDKLFKFLGQVCSVVCTTLVKDGIIASITVDKIERDPIIDDKINFYLTATAFIAGNYYDITLLVKTR